MTEGTDAQGEFSVGAAGNERILTNVADGRVANGSSDAVNGHQLYQVASVVDSNTTRIVKNEDDIANLDKRVTVNEGNIDSNTKLLQQHGDTLDNHETRITNLENKVDKGFKDLRSEINEGVALAAALQAPYVERDRRFAVRGAVGVGASAAFRLSSHWSLDAGFSYGVKSGSTVTTLGTQLSW